MADITIASWNVAGINSTAKRAKIVQALRSNDVQIACLQETHLTDLERGKLQRQPSVKQPAVNKHVCLDLKAYIETANVTKLEILQCCNTSKEMVMSQENTYLGQVITYEVNRKQTVTVNEELLDMLPKSSPFPAKLYRRCSVVGNGGILLNSCCGSKINQADFVIRCNLPPLNYSRDVGTKTNIVTANPSIIIDRYNSLNRQRRPFADMMKAYPDALVLMPPFSYVGNTAVSYKVAYTLQDFFSWQKTVFFQPDYLLNQAAYWKKKGFHAVRMSTGFMMVTAALELCDQITLYGYWPFSSDLEGNLLTYHYYDQRMPAAIHAMNQEFFFYTQMHSQGALRIQVGKCI
uniref:Alpha-2,8-sialyltransferase 8E-like n=1 Tax=Geotrypetes seraphini TaxID=260995 RepID=A0A6P8NSH5_GEOSA|nr:alpha-2,8-sialyltransferase 8E-like [Geotrypetes seraphini]